MAETHLPSLLRAPDADAAPEPRYVLPDEAGVIYIDPTLRRRACKWGTPACNKAVLDVFAKLREHPGPLGEAGFDHAWAEALAHWLGRLLTAAAVEERAEGERRDAAVRWEQAQLETTRAWRRLHVAAHSAGERGTLLTKPLPRRYEDVDARLGEALVRLEDAELRGRLALFQFKDAEHQALAQVRDERHAARAALLAVTEERRLLQDRVIVLRGVLLGEVTRFSKAARRLLPSDSARQVFLQRWHR